MILGILTNFMLLMLVHYLADYPLQGEYLAKGKNRFDPNNKDIWFHCLFAHSMIHALLVFAVTGSYIAFIYQAVTHFWIDYDKCKGELTYTQDQLLHTSVMAMIAILIHFT